MKRALLSLPLAAALALTTFPQDEGEAGLRESNRRALAAGSPELRSLVEAERAFARRSLEVGWREAFLEYFADDGVSFAPGPGNAKERLRQRPATPRPIPYTLDWWPVYAGVSAAGDMGFTTGPSVGTDNTKPGSPPNLGYYFSVWKRQPDGSWKVALDVGTETPELVDRPAARGRYGVMPAPSWRAKPKPADPKKERAHAERERAQREKDRAALLKMEREFFKKDLEGPIADYGGVLLREARLHRSGMPPLVGSQAILSYLYLRVTSLSWQPVAAEVSASRDLAYTYGTYDLLLRGENDALGASERGHYAHVWQRDEDGDWLLVADVMHAPPPGKR